MVVLLLLLVITMGTLEANMAPAAIDTLDRYVHDGDGMKTHDGLSRLISGASELC